MAERPQARLRRALFRAGITTWAGRAPTPEEFADVLEVLVEEVTQRVEERLSP